MKLPIYQVDAFASRAFTGNPAAVVPLQSWLADDVMQGIALENNLSETAFLVPDDGGFEIRWFTPQTEVDLCGHATLASAHVLFSRLGFDEPVIRFASRSGPLTVARDGDRLVLDFPARPPAPCDTPETIVRAFGEEPQACLEADDFVVVFEEESQVRDAKPDMSALLELDCRGVVITSRGEACDFVCRFFGPAVGIPEDPVTGSAYTELVPYWSGVLGKRTFRARQLSARGGELHCELSGDRVKIAGYATMFLEGMIQF